MTHPTTASAFEQIKHTDELGDFWLARELGTLLGYVKWDKFLAVIDEAKDVVSASGGTVEEVFTAVGKNSTARGGRPSKTYDYRLTRHACYIIAESADGRKKEVALAKIYFALTTERYELLAATEEERLRVEHRQQLLKENAELALRARAAGVMNDLEFSRFFNAGYLGLYHEKQADIRSRKGLKPSQDISDYMGSLETAANMFKSALARELMDVRGISTPREANATHREAGDSVRQVLMSKGIAPEQLPTPTKSYQQLLQEEEARQQILAENRMGLWSNLIDEEDDGSDEPMRK